MTEGAGVLGYYDVVTDKAEAEALDAGSGQPQLRPGQVLDRLAALRDRYAHPAGSMAGYVHGYAMSIAREGHLGESLTSEFSTGAYIMFYPYAPSMSEAHAGEWCTDVARGMLTAEVFQVTRDMMQVVREISCRTGHGAECIEEPVLPSPSGFAWFDSPLVFRDGNGLIVSTRAVSWQVIPIKWIPAAAQLRRPHAEGVNGMGVRILLWTLAGDPSSYEACESTVARLGDLQFDHLMVIPFGERFPASRLRAVDEEGKEVQSVLHYVHVIWQLMQSEIASSQRFLPDRATARRIRRSIRQGEVSVITLRRSHAPEGDEPGHREVDWSCRWLVQGHWRHLDGYEGQHHHAIADRAVRGEIKCYNCGGRITWVAAHVKGPDDRPLRASRHMFRLSR